MSDQPAAKKSRGIVQLKVLRTEWRTPHMIRLVLGGDGLADFDGNDFTDQYVKLLLPPAGVSYPEPFCLDTIQQQRPREEWPVRRTYTVRHFDPDLGELFIDFVTHGDEGIAGPWAAAAKPGDLVRLVGPGGAYAPRVDADWHLLIGDESAIPAIAVALERMPVHAPVRVLLQVANPDEEQKLESPGDIDATWLFRSDAQGPNPRQELVDAVTALELPPGQGHLFVHGEAETVMKQIRPHLLSRPGIDKSCLSISGYWRCGDSDEAFRAWKASQKAVTSSGV